MKNPDSFTLSQALEMQDGTLCVIYRAANSFNAIVPGHAIVTATAVVTDDNAEKTWNSRCSGKISNDQAGILASLIR